MIPPFREIIDLFTFLKHTILFSLFPYYLPFEGNMVLHMKKTWKPLPYGCFVPSFGSLNLEKKQKKMWKVHRWTTGDQKAHLNLRFRLAKSRGVPCQIVNLEQLRRDIFECSKNVPFLKFKSFCFHIKYRIRILMLLKMFISKC